MESLEVFQDITNLPHVTNNQKEEKKVKKKADMFFDDEKETEMAHDLVEGILSKHSGSNGSMSIEQVTESLIEEIDAMDQDDDSPIQGKQKKKNRLSDSSDDEFDILQFNSQEELQSSLKTSTAQNSPAVSKSSSVSPGREVKKRSSWIQCDKPECQKWRRLDHIDNLNSLADGKWVCCMNEDEKFNDCNFSQETLPEENSEDESVYATLKPGALVLGKLPGYPWWPAIVEDDPDYDSYFYLDKRKKDKVVVSYHVTFFGKDVSRAWLAEVAITNFNGQESLSDLGTLSYRGKNFGRGVKVALQEAKKAMELSTEKRLRRYSFLRRYKGDKNSQSSNDHSKTKIVDNASSEKKRRLISEEPEERKRIKLSQESPEKEKIRQERDSSVHQGKLTARKSKEEKMASSEKRRGLKEEKLKKKEEKRGLKEERLKEKEEKRKLKEEKLAKRERKEKKKMEKMKLMNQKENELSEEKNQDILGASDVAKATQKETDVKSCKLTKNISSDTLSKELTESEKHAELMVQKYIDPERLKCIVKDVDPSKDVKKLRKPPTQKKRNSNESTPKVPNFTQQKKKKEDDVGAEIANMDELLEKKKCEVEDKPNLSNHTEKKTKKKKDNCESNGAIDGKKLRKEKKNKKSINKSEKLVTNAETDEKPAPAFKTKSSVAPAVEANNADQCELVVENSLHNGEMKENLSSTEDIPVNDRALSSNCEHKSREFQEDDAVTKNERVEMVGKCDVEKKTAKLEIDNQGKKINSKVDMKDRKNLVGVETKLLEDIVKSEKKEKKKTLKDKKLKDGKVSSISEGDNTKDGVSSSTKPKVKLPKLVKPSLPNISTDSLTSTGTAVEKPVPKLKKPSFKAPKKTDAVKKAKSSFCAPKKAEKPICHDVVEKPDQTVPMMEITQQKSSGGDELLAADFDLDSLMPAEENQKNDDVLQDSPEF